MTRRDFERGKLENSKAKRHEVELPHRELTGLVIGAAIEVHKALRVGFLESFYEAALGVELRRRGLSFETQVSVPVRYRGIEIGRHRLDLLIEGFLVVELKATVALEGIHFAVLKSYLRATGSRFGLLFNFHAYPLDIRRVRAPS